MSRQQSKSFDSVMDDDIDQALNKKLNNFHSASTIHDATKRYQNGSSEGALKVQTDSVNIHNIELEEKNLTSEASQTTLPSATRIFSTTLHDRETAATLAKRANLSNTNGRNSNKSNTSLNLDSENSTNQGPLLQPRFRSGVSKYRDQDFETDGLQSMRRSRSSGTLNSSFTRGPLANMPSNSSMFKNSFLRNSNGSDKISVDSSGMTKEGLSSVSGSRTRLRSNSASGLNDEKAIAARLSSHRTVSAQSKVNQSFIERNLVENLQMQLKDMKMSTGTASNKSASKITVTDIKAQQSKKEQHWSNLSAKYGSLQDFFLQRQKRDEERKKKIAMEKEMKDFGVDKLCLDKYQNALSSRRSKSAARKFQNNSRFQPPGRSSLSGVVGGEIESESMSVTTSTANLLNSSALQATLDQHDGDVLDNSSENPVNLENEVAMANVPKVTPNKLTSKYPSDRLARSSPGSASTRAPSSTSYGGKNSNLANFANSLNGSPLEDPQDSSPDVIPIMDQDNFDSPPVNHLRARTSGTKIMLSTGKEGPGQGRTSNHNLKLSPFKSYLHIPKSDHDLVDNADNVSINNSSPVSRMMSDKSPVQSSSVRSARHRRRSSGNRTMSVVARESMEKLVSGSGGPADNNSGVLGYILEQYDCVDEEDAGAVDGENFDVVASNSRRASNSKVSDPKMLISKTTLQQKTNGMTKIDNAIDAHSESQKNLPMSHCTSTTTFSEFYQNTAMTAGGQEDNYGVFGKPYYSNLKMELGRLKEKLTSGDPEKEKAKEKREQVAENDGSTSIKDPLSFEEMREFLLRPEDEDDGAVIDSSKTKADKPLKDYFPLLKRKNMEKKSKKVTTDLKKKVDADGNCTENTSVNSAEESLIDEDNSLVRRVRTNSNIGRNSYSNDSTSKRNRSNSLQLHTFAVKNQNAKDANEDVADTKSAKSGVTDASSVDDGNFDFE